MAPWANTAGVTTGDGGGLTPAGGAEVPAATAALTTRPTGTGPDKKKAGKKETSEVTRKTDVVRIADAAKCEVYVCFEGSLGAHLIQEVRDKICKEEYVDFSLLPLEKFNFDRVKPDDSKKEVEKRRYRLIPGTFVTGYKCSPLWQASLARKTLNTVQPCFVTWTLSGRVYGGSAWLRYDVQFH